MSDKTSVRVLAATIALVVGPASAFAGHELAPALTAQGGSVELSRATVSGYVRAEGRPIANVLVTASSKSETQTTRTDSHGHYIFFALPGGMYVFLPSALGYSPCLVWTHREIESGFRYEIDLRLWQSCK